MQLLDAVQYPVVPWTCCADVRSFNRHWTVVLGLLDEGLLETDHPLPEARVLFELAQQDVWERGELRARLDIDESFLTRLLQRLQRKGLVAPGAVAARRSPPADPPDRGGARRRPSCSTAGP